MAELNGTDTDAFLTDLYAKAKETKERSMMDGGNNYESRN